MHKTFLSAAAAITFGLSASAHAQLFIDDLNTAASSANYNTLAFNANDTAIYGFDYSTLGIPEAPNSLVGGTTTGLQFNVNDGTNNATAIQSVLTNAAVDATVLDSLSSYTLTYDLWMNYNGPAPAGGSGSTEAMMVGAGFSNTGAIQIGSSDGSYFTVTGDGGLTTDVRSFTDGGFNETGVNAGPSNNTADEYYTGIFPGGIDISTFGQGGSQTGVTAAGQMAFEWHEVELVVDNVAQTVSFSIDGLLIASDTTTPDLDGYLFVGYGDYFSSASDPLSFSVVDNIVVSTAAIPEPASVGLLATAAFGLLCRRTR